MSATTNVAPMQPRANPSEQLRAQLNAMSKEFANALPSHIKPEKFLRVIMTVAQQQPDLLEADRRSLLGSCIKCAADGLIPDGREAALVIFNSKEKVNGAERWIKKVQYMPMLVGILKRVRNSGEVTGMEAHVIYENDHFVWRQGVTGTIEHTPLFPGDRGKPIGAYAIARFKDGSDPQFEVMDINQINEVRSVSKSKDGPTWTKWFGEMSRKTVARRLSKWLPMDADVETLFRRDDEHGAGEIIEGRAAVAEQAPGQIAAPSKLDVLEGIGDTDFENEHREAVTVDGEVE